MLTEMARMSVEDGLVMQIHPGAVRNHNRKVYERYGRDMGADIPGPTDYVHALRPLLDRFGNEKNLTHHSVHAGRVDVSAANWRRWRDIIRACALGRRGGSMTVLRA